MSSNKSKFLIFISLSVLFILLGIFLKVDQVYFKTQLVKFQVGVTGPLFVLLYVITTFFIWFGPKDAFRIAAAVVYGPLLSTALVLIAEMINAVVLFAFARKLGRKFVEKKLPEGWKKFDQNLARSGVWSIFLLRFFPVIPLRVLDLGFGLTQVSLRKYWFICLIATPARIFFLQFFLSLGLDVAFKPEKLEAYLYANPMVMKLTFIYIIGSFLLVFVLKKVTAR